MFIEMALQVPGNLLFQRRRPRISKGTNRNLMRVNVPTLIIDEDFDVAGAAVAQQDAGNRQFGRGFTRRLGGNLGHGAHGKAMFDNHGRVCVGPASGWVANQAGGIPYT